MGESRNTIFSLVPRESDSNQGVRFQVYIDRLSDYLGVERDVVIKILPSESEEYEPWKGAWPTLVGFFKNADEINLFLTGLSELKPGR